MLAFLDAGVNVKDAPNENFAREIMELFTMGVGHYGEADVREAARAFTGWNYRGLEFHVNAADHDTGEKTVLGQTGNFDGVEVIDIILAQPATAEFIAAKLYRHFVRDDLTPELQQALGAHLRELDYELAPFLATVFRSEDFYQPASMATRIKPPVELVVSTYRQLGLSEIPGVPDFNVVTGALGQRLMHPPTVAGWSGGRSWITPGLLFERGNFVLDVVFPDITFVPPDRYPTLTPQIVSVHERIRAGPGHHTSHRARRRRQRRHDGRFQPARRSRRGVQHPLRQLPGMANGHRTGQTDPAPHRSAGPRGHGDRRRARDTRRRRRVT